MSNKVKKERKERTRWDFYFFLMMKEERRTGKKKRVCEIFFEQPKEKKIEAPPHTTIYCERTSSKTILGGGEGGDLNGVHFRSIVCVNHGGECLEFLEIGKAL